MLVAAKKLADQLRAKKAFTNTSTFDLKCEVGIRYHLLCFGVVLDAFCYDCMYRLASRSVIG